MYSGSDSTESQNFPQWPINPSNYQNMANDQVDWAALAQQWIIMKEAGPPPIPGEQPVVLHNKSKKESSPEGGEAPMDMENDKEEPPTWPGPPQVNQSEWSWNNQNQTWAWNNQWVPPPSGVPAPPGVMKPPLLPTPNNYNSFNAPPESSSDNAVPFGGSNQNNDYSPVFWTNNKVIKPRNRRYSKVNVPTPIPPMPPTITEEPSTTPTLDAAKRKQLPAWIREGLEKMERDKLKQQEKEREKHEREIYNEKIKQSEKEKMEILKTTMKEQQRSRFESDGEDSEEEVPPSKKISFKPEPIPLTQEELIMQVRKNMTEILLKVTTAQIEAICREEHQRHVKKLKASDHRPSAPSGANISAKLGLGIYGEGSGSSSEDSDDEYNKDKRDSDSELKDIIKRKVNDFSRTEREIEDKLAEAESRKTGNASRNTSPDTIDNDSQVDARLQGPSKTPPRATSKTSRRSPSTSSDNSDSYVNSRSKASRRSTSSGSVDSRRRPTSKRKYSRSRSRTPPKKSRTRRSKSKTPPPKRHRRSRTASRDRRHTNGGGSSRRRSRSRSYSSRSRRSRSSSYRRTKRSYSRDRTRRSSRSVSRNRYTSRSGARRSRSRSSHKSARRRRSRSSSGGRGKRSHRY